MYIYSFDAFVNDVADVAAKAGEPRSAIESVGEHMRRLLAGPFGLDESFMRPQKGVISSHILHRDPDERFVVTCCAWGYLDGTPIHDHASWGVIGAVRNRVVTTTYRRKDEGDIGGFADVVEVAKVLVSETSFAHIRPPEELIHQMANPFKEVAVTLHVFGGLDPWGHMFDPPAKTITPFEPAENTIGV